MTVITPERISQLRREVEASNRALSSASERPSLANLHGLTTDELVALLDSANERNQLALECDMARRERDAAKSLAAGAERELQEVREQLTAALGDSIANYLTTPGLARAAASRVAGLTERAKRTGKFAGPRDAERDAARQHAKRRQEERRAVIDRLGLQVPDLVGEALAAVERGAITERAAVELSKLSPDKQRDLLQRSTGPDWVLAANLRTLLATIGLAPPDSWIDGAAAALAQVARLSSAGVGHRPALSDEDVEIIAEALEYLHGTTAGIVERGGREFPPRARRARRTPGAAARDVRGDARRRGRAVTCASGHNHEELKRDAERWGQLHYVGIQPFGGGEALELRNCACGSTLAVEIETASQAEVVS